MQLAMALRAMKNKEAQEPKPQVQPQGQPQVQPPPGQAMPPGGQQMPMQLVQPMGGAGRLDPRGVHPHALYMRQMGLI